MKSVQKFGSLLLAALMILSLTACGSKTNNTPAQTPSNDTPAGGKVLVVYYSASGNTKRVAEDIAEAADGDLFEITPAEPYTSDDLNWTNSDSRVSREHDDESPARTVFSVPWEGSPYGSPQSPYRSACGQRPHNRIPHRSAGAYTSQRYRYYQNLPRKHPEEFCSRTPTAYGSSQLPQNH